MHRYEKVNLALSKLAEQSDLDSFFAYTRDEVTTAESLLYDLKFTEIRLEKHIGNAEYWFMAQYKDDYLKGNSSYWSFFNLDTPQLVNISSSYNDVKSKPMMTDTVITQWWQSSIQTIDDVITELDERARDVRIFHTCPILNMHYVYSLFMYVEVILHLFKYK